jgi:hypothetical protein
MTVKGRTPSECVCDQLSVNVMAECEYECI